MSVTRQNVEATKAFIRARLGNPYVYGGALSTDPKVGTDCSEVWQTILEMLFGRWKPGRQSEGATTESYRYIPVGGVGPFGTIRVAHWRDIPADAVVKLAFHHGPGGGANSHMWGELDGMLIESAGSKGLVSNGRARPISDGYGHAWAYLPGPIVDGPPPPLGLGSIGPEVVALQHSLNAEGAGIAVDGKYGPQTAAAVESFNRRTKYAGAVLAEGQRRGISPRGIQITFTVPYVESDWKIYANRNVPESMSIPHDAVGSDHDSVGLFQQRCPMWGPAHVLMDPTKSAGLFYDRLVNTDYNNANILPGTIAADIQRPAAQYRGRYQERWQHAIALYNRITAAPAQEDELTPEQDQMLRAIFREQTQRHPSRSALRKPGEGLVDTWAGMDLNTDGNVHFVASFLRAWLGHPKTLEELRVLAGNTERRDDAELAQAILAEVADKPQPMVASTAGGVDTSAVVDAVRSAVAEAEPKIIYTAAPQPVTPQEPVAAASVSPTGSTGQRVGQLVDVLESLDLSSELPPEAKAPLQALINVLQTKIGASS